jgi:hypothetical protein
VIQSSAPGSRARMLIGYPCRPPVAQTTRIQRISAILNRPFPSLLENVQVAGMTVQVGAALCVFDHSPGGFDSRRLHFLFARPIVSPGQADHARSYIVSPLAHAPRLSLGAVELHCAVGRAPHTHR